MSLTTQRGYAYGVSLLIIGAVLWPAARTPPVDSFPLSNLPMFSHARPTEAAIEHVVAIGSDGNMRPVPPSLVAGAEVLQTKAAISYAIRRGRASRIKLCTTVAARLAPRDDWTEYTHVEVRRDHYHVLNYFDGNTTPLTTQRYARCKIKRAAP